MVSELPTFWVIGGACANSRYQALSSLFEQERPGIEATQAYATKNKLIVFSMNENVLHEKQNVINENIETEGVVCRLY